MDQAYSKHFPYIVPEATQQPYEVVPIIFSSILQMQRLKGVRFFAKGHEIHKCLSWDTNQDCLTPKAYIKNLQTG